MDKHVNTGLGSIILVIVTITALAFVWFIYKM